MRGANVEAIREAIERLVVDYARRLVAAAFDTSVEVAPGSPVYQLRLLLIEGAQPTATDADLLNEQVRAEVADAQRRTAEFHTFPEPKGPQGVMFKREETEFVQDLPAMPHDPFVVVATKPQRVRCSCRQRDAWRCASDRQLVDRMTCDCACHHPGKRA